MPKDKKRTKKKRFPSVPSKGRSKPQSGEDGQAITPTKVSKRATSSFALDKHSEVINIENAPEQVGRPLTRGARRQHENKVKKLQLAKDNPNVESSSASARRARSKSAKKSQDDEILLLDDSSTESTSSSNDDCVTLPPLKPLLNATPVVSSTSQSVTAASSSPLSTLLSTNPVIGNAQSPKFLIIPNQNTGVSPAPLPVSSATPPTRFNVPLNLLRYLGVPVTQPRGVPVCFPVPRSPNVPLTAIAPQPVGDPCLQPTPIRMLLSQAAPRSQSLFPQSAEPPTNASFPLAPMIVSASRPRPLSSILSSLGGTLPNNPTPLQLSQVLRLAGKSPGSMFLQINKNKTAQIVQPRADLGLSGAAGLSSLANRVGNVVVQPAPKTVPAIGSEQTAVQNTGAVTSANNTPIIIHSILGSLASSTSIASKPIISRSSTLTRVPTIITSSTSIASTPTIVPSSNSTASFSTIDDPGDSTLTAQKSVEKDFGVSASKALIMEKNPHLAQLLYSVLPPYVPRKPPAYLGIKKLKYHYCNVCKNGYIFQKNYLEHINRRSIMVKYKCKPCGDNQCLVFYNRCAFLKHVYEHKVKGEPYDITSAVVSPLPMALLMREFGMGQSMFEMLQNEDEDPDLPELLVDVVLDEGEEETFEVEETPVEEIPNQSGFIFECLECHQFFQTAADRKKHMSQEIETLNISSVPMCQTCSAAFPTECSLKAHTRIHKKQMPFVCPECGDCNNDWEWASFQRHVKFHCLHLTRNIGYACPVCKRVVSSKESLLQHLHLHMDVYLRCAYCPLSFQSQTGHCRHCVFSHPGLDILFSEVYKCPLCNLSFDQQTKLQTHQRKFHLADPMLQFVFNCMNCGMQHGSKKQLVEHIRYSHKFFYRTTIEMHFEREEKTESSTNKSQVQCLLCNRRLHYYATYIKHFAEIHGRHMRTCKMCNHRTSNLVRMINHGREQHLAKGDLVCLLCNNMPLQDTKALNGHLTGHVCQLIVCSYCPICNCRLGTYEDASAHLLFEHKKKSSNQPETEKDQSYCLICKMSFVSQNSFQQHLKSHFTTEDMSTEIPTVRRQNARKTVLSRHKPCQRTSFKQQTSAKENALAINEQSVPTFNEHQSMPISANDNVITPNKQSVPTFNEDQSMPTSAQENALTSNEHNEIIAHTLNGQQNGQPSAPIKRKSDHRRRKKRFYKTSNRIKKIKEREKRAAKKALLLANSSHYNNHVMPVTIERNTANKNIADNRTENDDKRTHTNTLTVYNEQIKCLTHIKYRNLKLVKVGQSLQQHINDQHFPPQKNMPSGIPTVIRQNARKTVSSCRKPCLMANLKEQPTASNSTKQPSTLSSVQRLILATNVQSALKFKELQSASIVDMQQSPTVIRKHEGNSKRKRSYLKKNHLMKIKMRKKRADRNSPLSTSLIDSIDKEHTSTVEQNATKVTVKRSLAQTTNANGSNKQQRNDDSEVANKRRRRTCPADRINQPQRTRRKRIIPSTYKQDMKDTSSKHSDTTMTESKTNGGVFAQTSRSVVNTDSNIICGGKSVSLKGVHVCHFCFQAFKSTIQLKLHMKCHEKPLTILKSHRQKTRDSSRKPIQKRLHKLLFEQEGQNSKAKNIQEDGAQSGTESITVTDSEQVGRNTCGWCDVPFADRATFKAHIKTHKEDPWSSQCQECGDCYSTADVLVKHLLIAHRIRDGKKYMEREGTNRVSEKPPPEQDLNICDVCFNAFSSDAELQSHMSSHEIIESDGD